MNTFMKAGTIAMGTIVAVAMQAATLSAQEISDTHQRAARGAVSAMEVTASFDNILPQAALSLKSELIQNNPDQEGDISRIVDETAIELAARRADLEREAATIYARVFTEQELTEITTFYESETGKKLISDGPIILREIGQAADVWARGIRRDLAQSATQKLRPLMPEADLPGDAEGEAGN